jgi:hypothetical protein
MHCQTSLSRVGKRVELLILGGYDFLGNFPTRPCDEFENEANA